MLFQLMIWFVLNPAARDVILYGVASASISLSTVNVLGKGYMTRVPDRSNNDEWQYYLWLVSKILSAASIPQYLLF